MEFTPSQLRALTALDKSLVVMASAGSGKTRVLVSRYERLIRVSELTPAQILAFTFTIKAAGEIKKRLIEAGILTPIDEAYAPIGTIHSFIMGILKTHGHVMGLKPDFEILDESEAILLRHTFIKNWLLKKLGLRDAVLEEGVSEWSFREILKLFLKLSQDANMAIYETEGNPEAAGDATLAGLLRLFLDCQKEFLHYKIQRATLDFSDLEVAALKLLKKHPAILRQLQEKFRHILVDEFQDINPIQGRLISILYQPGVNHLFIVGDPKQSIYRFRKADVEVFHSMGDHIVRSGGEVIHLAETFRLAPRLAGQVNELFRPLFEETSEGAYQALVPQRSDMEGHLKIIIAPTSGEKMETIRQAEAIHIAQALKPFRNDPSELKQSAILLRSTTYISIYADALKKQGIPFHMVKTGSLFEEQSIIDLLHLLNYFAGHTDLLTVTGILRSPLFGFSDVFIDHYIKSRPSDFMTGFVSDLFADTSDQARWSEFLPFMKQWTTLTKSLPPKALFLQVLSDLGFFGEPRAAHLPGFAGSMYGQASSCYHVEQFLTLIESPPAEAKHPYRHFQQLFENLLAQGETIQSLETAMARDGVSLMTIHASKGLEFKRVFLPEMHAKGPNESHLFLFDKKEGLKAKREDRANFKGLKKSFLELETYRQAKEKELAEQREEMKRLLYVAMTRAKDELTLFVKTPKSSAKEEAKTWNEWLWHFLKNEWDQGAELNRAPARETGFASLADRIEDRLLETTQAETETEPKEEEVTPPLEISRPPPSIYNVTELEAFHRCGKLYELAYLKGLGAVTTDKASSLPDALTAAQWGTLIHEVLQFLDFNSLENRQTVIEQALINQGLTDPSEALHLHINQTLDNLLNDKEVLRLLKYAPFECEKEFLLAQNSFFIKGTIDRLAFDGRIWHVIDYKTDTVRDDEVFKRKVDLYHFQLGLYAVAASRILNVASVRTSILFTQGPLLVTKDWDQRALAEMHDFTGHLHSKIDTARTFEYPEDRTLCPTCPYYHFNYCGVKSLG